MRALVIFCHPRRDSFNGAVLDRVMEHLTDAGAEIRVRDLYRDGFTPQLTEAEWTGYENDVTNTAPVQSDVDDLRWCTALIFVYPTWWYGLPAVLKGWLDRVLLPGVAFHMPSSEGRDIAPGLTHIRHLAVFTTCGASRWLTLFVGAPGKRTILRGVRLLCARRCRTQFAAHYLMDSSTPATRAAHLARIDRRMAKLLRGDRASAHVATA
ncbi:NAD(P)H-dependent oxidoreductase [Palleronia sp. LCG004]|uniref:NAD(P)H-dependent oxidoreductase n=1 Tax=Palleronia sp. LCG004 TaxID=3079304 RepID=UPI0029422DD5|nr:NAD(P)H-dependent oxidoreductase [Palleronia sp. LCG004]WOI58342.1 NAD(P)H-dependent oxidoreductase [Palleronia sp. LCG004]